MSLTCRKTAVVSNSSIIGKWTLVETFTDPGNGNGKWMPVNRPDYYFIKFDKDNSIESNISRGSGNAFNYKILTDSTLYLIYPESDTVSYFYEIHKTLLILEGGCFEQCRIKFKKEDK